MCEEHKFGGLWDDPERLKRYQKLFEEAFPGKTALDILHRTPVENSFYIDSSIFLGTVIQDENTRACKSFFC